GRDDEPAPAPPRAPRVTATPAPAAAPKTPRPATAQRRPAAPTEFHAATVAPAPDAAATAAALLADAAHARQQGDLRTTLALLRAAVEQAPSVETWAALGGLYYELGAARAAEPNLRAAAEGDPDDPDRWIALANALALKPDPMAAAGALEQA